MIDVKLRYQSILFGNFKDIVPTPERIKSLLDAFSGKSYIPSTFTEISPFFPDAQTRLVLVEQKRGLSINIGIDRIVIDNSSVDLDGETKHTLTNFVKEAAEIIENLGKVFNTKSYRLSLITAGLLEEMTPDNLHKVYAKIANPIQYYKENEPFEWNTRAASLARWNINASEETVNVVTNIDRLKGNIAQNNIVKNFDRICVSFDINTHAGNLSERFGLNEFSKFNEFAIAARNGLLDDIKELLHEK